MQGAALQACWGGFREGVIYFFFSSLFALLSFSSFRSSSRGTCRTADRSGVSGRRFLMAPPFVQIPPRWLSLALPQVLVGQRHHWGDLRKASTRTLDAGVACGESAGEHAMGFDTIKENHQHEMCTDWTQTDQWDDTRPATRCKRH